MRRVAMFLLLALLVPAQAEAQSVQDISDWVFERFVAVPGPVKVSIRYHPTEEMWINRLDIIGWDYDTRGLPVALTSVEDMGNLELIIYLGAQREWWLDRVILHEIAHYIAYWLTEPHNLLNNEILVDDLAGSLACGTHDYLDWKLEFESGFDPGFTCGRQGLPLHWYKTDKDRPTNSQ